MRNSGIAGSRQSALFSNGNFVKTLKAFHRPDRAFHRPRRPFTSKQSAALTRISARNCSRRAKYFPSSRFQFYLEPAGNAELAGGLMKDLRICNCIGDLVLFYEAERSFLRVELPKRGSWRALRCFTSILNRKHSELLNIRFIPAIEYKLHLIAGRIFNTVYNIV